MWGRFLRQALPPLSLAVIVAAVWHLSVAALRIPPYLLPSPIRVGEAAFGRSTDFVTATLVTGAGALSGYLASLLLGAGIALVFSQSPLIRRSCYPYAIFLQTVPIVAIAPLVVTFLGTGFHSVVVISCVISLFPVITSTTSGLVEVDESLCDLFRLHRASRWQQLRMLRIPHAVPSYILGATTASGLAVVGAIVGEFFVGYGTRHHGLGFIILYAGPQLRTDQLFAATIASALLGVAMFATTNVVGRAVIRRWYGR